ncbi:MAG: glycosyltransferase family 39 protein [Elusimicrobiota bacterium]
MARFATAFLYWEAPLSPGGDDLQYHELASGIASGRGYLLQDEPSAYRGPLYPLFLAAAMRVTASDAPGVLRLIQAILGLLALWLVYRLGAAIHSPEAGAWAAMLMALYPEQVLLPTSLYTECFYALILLVVAWALACWRQDPRPARLAGLGAAIGLSLLTRSTLAALPVLLAAWRLAELRAGRRWLRETALLAVTVLLPLTPWIVRNYARFGRVIPMETGVAGPALWYASKGWVTAPSDMSSVEPMRTMYRRLPHTEWDRFATPRALRNMRARPMAYLLGCAKRALYLWTTAYTPYLLYYHHRLSAWMQSGGRWSWIALGDWLLRLCLILPGAWVLLRSARKRGGSLQRLGPAPASNANPKGGRHGAPTGVDAASTGERGLWAVAGLVLYFHIHVFATVFVRYMAPVTPLLCVLAGAGWAEWRASRRG